MAIDKDLQECNITASGAKDGPSTSSLDDSTGGVGEEDLRRCYDESPVAQHVQREYDQGEDRDKYIHEVAGFKDWRSWCEDCCKVGQRDKNVLGGEKQSVKYVCQSCNNFEHR